MENWCCFISDDFDLFDDVLTDIVFSLGTLGEQSIGAGREPRYPPPYTVEKYIRFHMPNIDVLQFSIISLRQKFTMHVGYEEPETAYAGSYQRWKHWGRRRDQTAETHKTFMNMLFVRSYKVE